MKTSPTFAVTVDGAAQRIPLRDGIAARKQVPVVAATDGANPADVIGFVDAPRLGSSNGVSCRFHLLETHPRADGVRRGLRNGRVRQYRFEAQIAKDGRCDLVRLVPNQVELSVGGFRAAAAAGAAAAGRRAAAEGIKFPERLPAPFNNWKMTGKRFLRLNKRTLIRAGVDGAVVGTAVYAGSRLAQRAEDEKRERRLRKLSARIDRAIAFARPTVHRILDAAGREVEVPSVPGAETVRTTRRILEKRPGLRAALWKAGALAAGAAGGAYLGLRLHGRSRKTFVKAGAAAGGLGAALLFETPMKNSPEHEDRETIDRVGWLIEDNTKRIRGGRRESHDPQSLACRLGVTIDVVEELLASGELRSTALWKGRDGWPRVFEADALNDIRARWIAEAATQDLPSAGSEDPDHLAQVAATGIARRKRELAARVSATEFAERDDLGRYQERRPSALAKVAKVIGAAGVLGAGLYARGRMGGAGLPGLRGIPGTIRAGAGLLAGDARKGYGAARAAVEDWRRR